jgi:calcineurin-like phosphoesterase family protein
MKLVLEKDQNLFFTSDTHYKHSSICRATTTWVDADDKTRDFKSLEDMNDAIVNNINEVVGEDDVLFHLGDWSFGGFGNIEEFRSRIICKNIHLVLGNHDHHIERNKDNIQRLFTTVNHYINLDLRRPSIKGKGQMDKYRFILCHFPIASWDGMNNRVMHLFGHVHLPPHHRLMDGRALDVGCEGNDLKPISLDEVVSLLKDQPIDKLCLPRDHHVKRVV